MALLICIAIASTTHYNRNVMKQTTAQVTFRLPRRLVSRLDQLARRRRTKRSEILREAAEAYVDFETSHTTPRPYGQVKNLIGSVRSGIPDLAERHSEYLKQILADDK